MTQPAGFSAFFKAWRGERLATECAEQLGKSIQTILDWCAGTSRPPKTARPALAAQLGITADQLTEMIEADRAAAQQAETAKITTTDETPAGGVPLSTSTASPDAGAGEQQRATSLSELLKPALDAVTKADEATAIAYAAADSAAAASATAAKNLAAIASKVLGPSAARPLIEAAESAERHAVRSPSSSPEAES